MGIFYISLLISRFSLLFIYFFQIILFYNVCLSLGLIAMKLQNTV